MENMMVSPQAGEWTARSAGSLRRDMESMAAAPRFGGGTAEEAYRLGETRKGRIEMKRYANASGHRIRGWLTLIPIRIAAGVICLPLLTANTALAILYVLALGCCAALFCLRCRGFRTMYVGAAALGLALGIAALPDSVGYLIAQSAVEIALIPALYLSRRVKDNFFGCSRKGAAAADTADSRKRDCGDCDVYMTAYRPVR